MNIRPDSPDHSYTPVAWEYRELFQKAIETGAKGKIFYFCKEQGICEQTGTVVSLDAFAAEGDYITIDNSARIRIDRIITLFGKPGPAYGEYDAYSNVCQDCKGGDDLNEP